MATNVNAFVNNNPPPEPPPLQPPPIITPNTPIIPPPPPNPPPIVDTPTINSICNRLLTKWWNELVGKSSSTTSKTINTKVTTIKPRLSPQELTEDTELVHMIMRHKFRVCLNIQSDCREHTYITNNVLSLHHTTEIDDYRIDGIGSGISYTHKGIFT